MDITVVSSATSPEVLPSSAAKTFTSSSTSTATVTKTKTPIYHVRRLRYLADSGHNETGAPVMAPLAECQSVCYRDSDCHDHLKCFFRSRLEPIPGCPELDSKWSGVNYCYDPSKKLSLPKQTSAPAPLNPTFRIVPPQQPPTFVPVSSLVLVGDNGVPPSVFPLQRCEGDWYVSKIQKCMFTNQIQK